MDLPILKYFFGSTTKKFLNIYDEKDVYIWRRLCWKQYCFFLKQELCEFIIE